MPNKRRRIRNQEKGSQEKDEIRNGVIVEQPLGKIHAKGNGNCDA